MSSSEAGSCWLDVLPCAALELRAGAIVAANEAACAQAGIDLRGAAMPIGRLLLGDIPEVTAGEPRQDFECLMLRANDRPAVVQGAVGALEDGARLVLLMPRHADVQGESAQASFLGDLLDSAPEAIAITHAGSVLHVNREFTALFGYQPGEVMGSDLDAMLLPEGRQHEEEIVQHMLQADGRAALETQRRTKLRALVDVSLLVAPVRLSGASMGMYHTFRDIGRQKAAEARLEHLAMHDPLTGAPNRALFTDRLRLMMARLKRRPERHFAVMFLDLDHFKRVNDTYGHAAGDQLLLEMTRRFCVCVRPQDTLARFGGDEFALLLDEAGTAENVAGVAERLQVEAKRAVATDSGEVYVSASIGIAMVTPEFSSAETVMHAADVAMYRAKANGKGRHEFATQHGGATMHAWLESSESPLANVA
jgi:diguanylate cyclase (GGDEF)-like protein/PAS domain S-box-containing protein